MRRSRSGCTGTVQTFDGEIVSRVLYGAELALKTRAAQCDKSERPPRLSTRSACDFLALILLQAGSPQMTARVDLLLACAIFAMAPTSAVTAELLIENSWEHGTWVARLYRDPDTRRQFCAIEAHNARCRQGQQVFGRRPLVRGGL